MRIAIIGGDARLMWLSALYAERGWRAPLIGWPGRATPADAGGADAVHLPIPRAVTVDGHIPAPPGAACKVHLEDVLAFLSPGCLVVAGRVPDQTRAAILARGARLFIPQEEDEAYIRDMAELTAEGALHAMMGAGPDALRGARVMILGYGRIAQALHRLSRAAGAHVYVAARAPAQLSAAQNGGAQALPLEDAASGEALPPVDFLVNTIPARVLPVEKLKALSESAVVCELADGFDPARAKALLDGRFMALGGLPGVYAPRAAARALMDSTLRRLGERA